jgi:molecular chaperone GrpE
MPDPESTNTLNNPTAAQPDPSKGAAASAKATADQLAEVKALPQPAPAKPVEDALTTAKAEAAANYDKFMRATADLENFRRRTVREKDELRQLATARVVEDILPALDNLALGLAAAKQPNADLKSLVGGIDMVLAQLRSALANHGLKEINPAGQPFDPHQHESISHQPSADVKEEHVLRPSSCRAARGKNPTRKRDPPWRRKTITSCSASRRRPPRRS